MIADQAFSLALRAAWPLLVRRGETTTWRERWRADAVGGQVDVWIHAASLGELAPYHELLGELAAVGRRFGITVTSGRTLAEVRRRFADRAEVRPAPLPGSPALATLVAAWRPRRFVLLEAEAWPALLQAASRHGADVAVLGGRSDRSRAGVWRRLPEAAKASVHATDASALSPYARARWPQARLHGGYHAKLLGAARPAAIPDELRVWAGEGGLPLIGGSLHPADAEVLAAALLRLLAGGIAPRLLVLPRHLDRRDAVMAPFQRAGLSVAMFPHMAQITLVPQMGLLAGAYGLGRVALVGGAWARRGGHNPIEAIVHGVPAVIGPHDRNQRGLAAVLPDGALTRASTPPAVADAVLAAAGRPAADRAAWPAMLAAAATELRTRAAAVLSP
jgi:3-deoxy-D-manno-octulosonic-acid transferase